jgi:hypothetical protein
MPRVGAVILLVFAVACLASAAYVALNGVTPSLMRHVRGLDAGNASSVITFLVVMGTVNGGIAIKLLVTPTSR